MEYDGFCLPILKVYPKYKTCPAEHEWDPDAKYTPFVLEISSGMHPPKRNHP